MPMRATLLAALVTAVSIAGSSVRPAAAQPARVSPCFVGIPLPVMGCPLARAARLSGTLTYDFLTPDSFSKRITVPLAARLEFTADFTGVRVVGNWPRAVLDDSAPLHTATDGVTVTMAGSAAGRYEPATGHMVLPVTLHLDYLRNYDLGRRDQDVTVSLSTRGGGAGMRLWESPPFMGFGGETRFSTREYYLGASRGHTLTVIVSGALDPLPPRP